MKAVDFYKLPRAIQDRFVGSVMSGFPPAPILAAKGGAPIKFFWLALSGASFVVLIVVARLGYGGLDSALSLHSGKALPLYAGLVFGFAFGLVQAFGRVVRERALPYTPGVYLFPACLIDARNDQFRVFETRDLENVELRGATVSVTFKGGAQFAFPLSRPEAGVQLVQDVQTARTRALQAQANEEPKELVAVDPLHVPRFSSPVGPRDAYEMKRPPWGKLGPVVAGVVAVAIGPGLWALRNAKSDKKMYALATKANDSESYRNYLAHGEAYKAEVGEQLLPRAELRDAERVGTAEALIAYKRQHPGSKIAPEVAASIRRSMLAELEKAKAPGTLAALHEFAKKYPEHGIEPEYRAAIHAVYSRELEAYRKKAPARDKAAVAFVERLFVWAEKHGSKVEIRFRRRPSTSLERADNFILKTPTFMGVVTYPSRFFDEKHAVPREAELGKQLAAQFGSGLAPELFDVAIGPVVTETDLPEPKDPTLYITHVAEWSGHNYTANRPRGSYVGINFDFEAVFVIPGDAKPYKYKTEIFRHAATHVLKDDEPMLGPGAAEEKVYEAMGHDAFEKFAKQLLAGFFPAAPK